MPMNDVFSTNASAFNLMSLTAAINRAPQRSSRLRQLGLFQADSIPTTKVAIEEESGVLTLLSTKARGAPGTVIARDTRKITDLTCMHLKVEDTFLADAYQNVREFGEEGGPTVVEREVAKRLLKMRYAIEDTIEYAMAGAIQGLVRDNSGTIYNLFTVLNLTEQTTNFALTTSTTEVIQKVMEAKRKAERKLGGMAVQRWHAMCGETFFANLVAHASVKTMWANYQSQQLSQDVRNAIVIGGVTFEEYSVQNASGTPFLPAAEARLIPIGIPDFCKIAYAPADYQETVNTIGQPFYARQEPLPMNRGRQLEVQSNPLPYCTRPECLIKLTNA